MRFEYIQVPCEVKNQCGLADLESMSEYINRKESKSCIILFKVLRTL